MRTPTLLAGIFLTACIALRAEENWKPLWNGRDLSAWTTWLAKPHVSVQLPGEPRDAAGNYAQPLGANHDPLGVFTVVTTDGQPAIRVSGRIFGELRTKESLSNYHLRLQFKWGEKKWPPRDKPAIPRDSGLLYHVHAEPGSQGRTWSPSIEFQIQEHDVGDLYAISSQISVRCRERKEGEKTIFEYDPNGTWKTFSQVPGSEGRCVKQPDNEKPNGEWNTLDLICLGEDSIHIVNGKVVMRLHGARRIDGATPFPVTAGPIILQSEGSELYYRNIEYCSITAVPAEWAEK